MSANQWVTVRVWFTKTHRAKYISHLDLNRCMTRAVHKARIPLWYTEGFNPHPFLTFALPLSLGIDGIHESMDIRLVNEIPKEELIAAVNAGLPQDIRLYDVTEVVMKPGKIAAASFDISFEPDTGTAEKAENALRRMLDQETIMVKKRSKSGIKDVDLKPDLDLRDIRTEDGQLRFTAMLPAGSVKNINPYLLFDALEQYENLTGCLQIVRTNLYNGEGDVFV